MLLGVEKRLFEALLRLAQKLSGGFCYSFFKEENKERICTSASADGFKFLEEVSSVWALAWSSGSREEAPFDLSILASAVDLWRVACFLGGLFPESTAL
jgi:hypothetical protein